jgi:hypothetical protein
MVPAAALVLAIVLFTTRTTEVPLAERRPADGVGEIHTGETEPVTYERACPLLEGVRIAGGPSDQESLRAAIAALCNVPLPDDVSDRLRRFAEAEGVVRFAVFERSAVDVTSDLAADPPVVYPNARFTQTDPLWIAPLLVHETVFLVVDHTTADGLLEARRAEHRVCQLLLSGRREPQGCRDAAALLDLPDPLAALRDAGFR